MKRLRLLLISSLAGLAGGFGFRAFQYHRQLSPAAEAVPPALAKSATPPENHSDLPPGPPEESVLIARLKADLARSAALSDDVTRWLHWMTAVEKAAPADYPRLASMAKDLPGALRPLPPNGSKPIPAASSTPAWMPLSGPPESRPPDLPPQIF